MRSLWRGARLGTAAAAACAITALAPADSSGLEIEYVKGASTVSGATQDSVDVSCPPGLRLSGGGAWSAGGYGFVGLNTTYPQGETGWRSYYDSEGATVLIRSWAICIDRNPVIKQRGSEATTTSSNVVSAGCKRSQRITGGGAFSSGAYHQTAVKHIIPFGRDATSSDIGHVRRFQVNLANTSNPYQNIIPFSAYAICHENLAVTWREKQSNDRGPGLRTTVTARCHDDEHVLGGGGLAASLKIYPVNSFPIDSKADGDKRPDDGWRVQLDNHDVQGGEVIASRAACVKT
jgi:hypothetical protein